MRRSDIVIIGAGVAGTSLAWALAKRAVTSVLVLERENGPALHASGRSARTLFETDPNPTIQRLKLAAAPFIKNPPAGFAERPLLDRRGALRLLSRAEAAAAEAAMETLRRAGVACDWLTPVAACAMCEALDERAFEAAIYLRESGFIDVHALIAAYVAHARAAGVQFVYGARVNAVEHGTSGLMYVDVGGERIGTGTVVNAAGAWAAELATLAGCAPLELAPLRRSLALYEAPPAVDMRRWPLVLSEAHEVYFRPLDGDVMLCPMDADASVPCDARPVTPTIEAAYARLASIAPSLGALPFRRAWAGLRTFSDDGVPVIGRDLREPALFWLAGQGGCGIETSPLLAEVAADLLVAGSTDRFDARLLAPDRFAH